MSAPVSPGPWPARLDLRQSATGLFLALFMWLHMLFVASILFGTDAMWRVARFFEGDGFFGRSLPWLVSLFVAVIFCGEAGCWDLHGFTRLGGNSVAETVVAGMLLGEYVADFCCPPREITASPSRWRAISWRANRPICADGPGVRARRARSNCAAAWNAS